jgi:hypothetical protein
MRLKPLVECMVVVISVVVVVVVVVVVMSGGSGDGCVWWWRWCDMAACLVIKAQMPRCQHRVATQTAQPVQEIPSNFHADS